MCSHLSRHAAAAGGRAHSDSTPPQRCSVVSCRSASRANNPNAGGGGACVCALCVHACVPGVLVLCQLGGRAVDRPNLRYRICQVAERHSAPSSLRSSSAQSRRPPATRLAPARPAAQRRPSASQQARTRTHAHATMPHACTTRLLHGRLLMCRYRLGLRGTQGTQACLIELRAVQVRRVAENHRLNRSTAYHTVGTRVLANAHACTHVRMHEHAHSHTHGRSLSIRTCCMRHSSADAHAQAAGGRERYPMAARSSGCRTVSPTATRSAHGQRQG